MGPWQGLGSGGAGGVLWVGRARDGSECYGGG